ncbi:hypothetical protein GGR57DRAFT_505005 [Xylariaceae sp. FL1272]|nr:hypothetical protein GGR57DRAFT_505005 [Xylariaceae sp. FL1272]
MSWDSECNNRIVRRWLRSVSPKTTLNLRLSRLSASHSEPPSLASNDIVGMEQGVNLYTAPTSGTRCSDVDRSRIGTGFDGPQSSLGEKSPPLSPSDASDTAMSSSLLKEDRFLENRRLRSESTGSIDWGVSWPRRKPRRAHYVSEASNPEPPPPPTRNTDEHSATNRRNTKQALTYKTIANGVQTEDNGPRDQAVHWSKLKSCPDLQQDTVAAIQPEARRLSVDKDCGIGLYNYSKFDDDRHQHHFHMPATIYKRFRYFRNKFRRSQSSSTFSMRADFPAPPDGRKRRYLSRVSTDIWPSSGEESVIFNTPNSNGTPSQLGHDLYTDSSNASGLMTELDRLSTSLNGSDRPGSPELGQPHMASGMASPQSESGVSDILSNNPLNFPSLAFSRSALASPVPRPLQGRKRRGQQSRLSEVTTPEDLRSPAEPANESRLQSPLMTSLDSSVFLEYGRHGNLVPEPLSISQSASSGPSHEDDSRVLLQTLVEDKELPTKISSVQTKLMRGINAVTGETLREGKEPASCHPDTWTEEQGEPGNSDPFCPPRCQSPRIPVAIGEVNRETG